MITAINGAATMPFKIAAQNSLSASSSPNSSPPMKAL